MFILRHFIEALAAILNIAIPLAYWLIIIRALLSWVSPDPYNPIVQFIYKVTEPILAPFKRILPMRNVGLDLSPLLAILALVFLRYFLVATLVDIASRIR